MARERLTRRQSQLGPEPAPVYIGSGYTGGRRQDHPEQLEVPGKIEGKVIAYGPEGNLVTDIAHAQLAAAPRDPSVTIRCDEHETVGLFAPEHQEPAMSFLAVLAPGGFLELTIVGDSAQAMLGIRLGEKVTVSW
jgi:S-adenosylmethionine hydrolase